MIDTFLYIDGAGFYPDVYYPVQGDGGLCADRQCDARKVANEAHEDDPVLVLSYEEHWKQISKHLDANEFEKAESLERQFWAQENAK